MEPASIRVLIVEDHPIVRYGLVALIDSQQDMKVVGQSGDGEEAGGNHPETAEARKPAGIGSGFDDPASDRILEQI